MRLKILCNKSKRKFVTKGSRFLALFGVLVLVSALNIRKSVSVDFEINDLLTSPAKRVDATNHGNGDMKDKSSSPGVATNLVRERLSDRSYDNLEPSTRATTTTSAAITNTTIRQWGCHRQEAPFIFVHIGKAGGGGVRARIAASSLNYTGGDNWKDITQEQDGHYYPIGGNNQLLRGKLCDSLIRHHRVPESTFIKETQEGFSPCNATTPLGMAIGCPQTNTNRGTKTCLACRDMNATTCPTVYVGHNHLGSEIHWLPPRILKTWWSDHWKNVLSSSASSVSFGVIDSSLDTLLPGNKQWCAKYNQPRPTRMRGMGQWFEKCAVPLSHRMDAHFNNYWKDLQQTQQQREPRNEWLESVSSINAENINANFGPLYASLPVQRVTMLREPISWLLSKVAWHRKQARCDNMTRAATGWAHDFSMEYLLFLCGVDCINRYDHGTMTLSEIEHQAAYNLRESFSVVGLLNETDVFYDMISARVAYMDTSLNPSVKGERHVSFKGTDVYQCTKLFRKEQFRKDFFKAVPALAAVQRLYKLGVEVNRFQKKELDQCKSDA